MRGRGRGGNSKILFTKEFGSFTVSCFCTFAAPFTVVDIYLEGTGRAMEEEDRVK